MPAHVELFDETGTSCATNNDALACKARLKALVALTRDCWANDVGCTPFAVTTVGNEVRRFDDRKELIALLGTIDSPEKAVIVASWDGLDLRCWREDTYPPGGSRLRFEHGWQVQSKWSDCGGPITRTMQIDGAGNLISDTTVEPAVRSHCEI